MGDIAIFEAALHTVTPTAAGIWMLVLMIGAFLLREWRENRKLSAEDRLARREGYAAQVSMLMGENRKLRGDLAAIEKRHEEYRRNCLEENEALRKQVLQLEAEINELKSTIRNDELEIARLRLDANSQVGWQDDARTAS